MSAGTGDAAALAGALQALGFPCAVEGRAGLALITMPAADASRFAARADRTAAVALAREHGFTHLAVELGAHQDAARAAVLRD